MRLAAEVLILLRDPDEPQSDSGYSSDCCPKTLPRQYSERNHLSVLIQTPNADLSHIPAEGVVALVQAVGNALDQKYSREDLAQWCAKVMEMLQPAVLSGNRTKCTLMSLQLLKKQQADVEPSRRCHDRDSERNTRSKNRRERLRLLVSI